MRLRKTEVVCREVVELVTDLLEGALTGRVRRAVVRHLRSCEHCTEYVRQLTQTIAMLRALGSPASTAATRAPTGRRRRRPLR